MERSGGCRAGLPGTRLSRERLIGSMGLGTRPGLASIRGALLLASQKVFFGNSRIY